MSNFQKFIHFLPKCISALLRILVFNLHLILNFSLNKNLIFASAESNKVHYSFFKKAAKAK